MYTVLTYRGNYSGVPGCEPLCVGGGRGDGQSLLLHVETAFVPLCLVSFLIPPLHNTCHLRIQNTCRALPDRSSASLAPVSCAWNLGCFCFRPLVASSPSASCPPETCWNLFSVNHMLLLGHCRFYVFLFRYDQFKESKKREKYGGIRLAILN